MPRYKGLHDSSPIAVSLLSASQFPVIIIIIMVNVAIAGGRGAVGRTFADVIASQKKHTAIVLTRKVGDDITPHAIVTLTSPQQGARAGR